MAQCKNKFNVCPSPSSDSGAVRADSLECKLVAPVVRSFRVVRQPGRFADFVRPDDLQDASSDDNEDESSDSSGCGADSEVERITQKVVHLSLADVLPVGSQSAVPLQMVNESAVSDVRPVFSLPSFVPAHEPEFEWGMLSGHDALSSLKSAYEVIAKFRPNTFDLPGGGSGKSFVQEITRLNRAFADRSPSERISNLAEMVMPALLLQRPLGSKRNPKEYKECLERRLELWKHGDIASLLKEAVTIQDRLSGVSGSRVFDETTSRRFAEMVFSGNGRGAMAILSSCAKGGVLPLTDDVVSDLKKKHPKAEEADVRALIQTPLPDVDLKAIFEAIDGEKIKRCTLRTEGAAGVSQATDKLWRKMVSSFKASSVDLCKAVADVARRMATEYVDPVALAHLLSNKGLPLDKMPGVRPIGIGEIKRRIIGKAIVEAANFDIQKAAGPLQLCAGQSSGVEAAVHAMKEIWELHATDGILMVDADNAFNRLNRKVALWNIQFTCPALKCVVINTYRVDSSIYILGGVTIQSSEGTTQGDPIAMVMYAVSLSPLTQCLLNGLSKQDCKQVWFADDGNGGGKLEALRAWWDALASKGPMFGYFPNAAKSVLLVKESCLVKAEQIFEGTQIKVDVTGQRHLGAVIGSAIYKTNFVKLKVDDWVASVNVLAKIAVSQPHAAHSVFVHRLQAKWGFLMRTVPSLSELLQPLEEAIRMRLIPAILGKEVSDLERSLLSLPAKFAGLGIRNPVEECQRAYERSKALTVPLTDAIIRQAEDFDPGKMKRAQDLILKQQYRASDQFFKEALGTLSVGATPGLKIAINLACEKGASSWAMARPLHEFGTVLHKRDFRDAVFLRYGWEPPGLFEKCACGALFNVAHATTCMTGGFRIMMHNDLAGEIADRMSEAGCRDVMLEPDLLPVDGEAFKLKSANKEDDARSDIRVDGFWGKKRRAFFDVMVFTPFARSYLNRSLKSVYAEHEGRKNRQYKERILKVEQADFTPLVFSLSGGMGPQAQAVVRRLGELLAGRQNVPRSVMMGWLRTRLSFTILRAVIACLRGCRSLKFEACVGKAELAMSEARIGSGA